MESRAYNSQPDLSYLPHKECFWLGRVFGHWEEARVTWDEASDTFLVEVTSDERLDDDPFNDHDKQRNWLVRKEETHDYWMALTIYHVWADERLAKKLIQKKYGTQSLLWTCSLMFKQRGVVELDLVEKCIDMDHVVYDQIEEAYRAKHPEEFEASEVQE